MSNAGKRVAWVTGGGSGIGEAGAEALAAEGWSVVVSGRKPAAAGLRQRNPDQPDLEPGFYPDASQSRLTKSIARKEPARAAMV